MVNLASFFPLELVSARTALRPIGALGPFHSRCVALACRLLIRRGQIGGLTMTSVTFATPFRTAPRAFHYSAPPRPFSDDAGAALNEAEASELAVRLIGARSEAKFNPALGSKLSELAT